MLYIDIPTREEFLELADLRSDACVSIYLQTSPLRQELDASRIQLGNAIKEAIQQLEDINFDKRRLLLLEDQLLSILEDDDFWHFHAHSLAILATPDCLRTYRLANDLNYHVEVACRFYIKPLLRAVTFPHTAYIFALSENENRLIEFFADIPPEEIKVADMPVDAPSAVGKRSLHTHAHSGGRIHGEEGKKIRLAQYTRKIDQALRPIFNATDAPLILASTEPLTSIFRSTNSIRNLVDDGITVSPDRISISELVEHARPLLDSYYQQQINSIKAVFEQRAHERRVTFDMSDAARAATFGSIDTLLVDIDEIVPGTIDQDGNITFSEKDDAHSYGVIDEIVKRAMATNAKILAVRKNDIPQGGALAAILRYPL